MKKLVLLAAAVAALVLVPASGFAADQPFVIPKDAKEALAKYDFSTPAAALKSVWTMEANFDIIAMIAYERLTRGKKALQRLNTLEVVKEAEHDGKKFLFVKYKDFDDNENKERERKEIISMVKDADSGLWVRRYTGSYEVAKTNKALAEEMDKFTGNTGNTFKSVAPAEPQKTPDPEPKVKPKDPAK